MRLLTIIKSNEFFLYFIIGGVATLIDWSTFWTLTTQLHTHYQMALCGSYLTAGTFHYIANKFFTFECKTKKIGSQYSIYFLVSLTSLLCNMGVMSILMTYTTLGKMSARILTTALILIPNYLLHKYITFSKKIFFHPETH